MSLFGDYLNQRPLIINDRNKLMGLIKDSLSISEVKYASSIEYAYNEDIILVLKEEFPLSKEKYNSFIDLLTNKYIIAKDKAEFAINFWITGLKDFDFNYLNLISTEKYPICDLAGPIVTSIRSNAARKEISIQWRYNSDAEKYQIWRSVNNSQSELIIEDFFPITRYTDKNLEPGFLYHYYMRTLLKNNNLSQMSSSADLILPTENNRIQINEIRFINGNINISWNFSLNSKKIIIKRKASSENSWNVLQELDGSKFSFVDKENLYGSYCYQLEIINNKNVKYNTTPISINVAVGS